MHRKRSCVYRYFCAAATSFNAVNRNHRCLPSPSAGTHGVLTSDRDNNDLQQERGQQQRQPQGLLLALQHSAPLPDSVPSDTQPFTSSACTALHIAATPSCNHCSHSRSNSAGEYGVLHCGIRRELFSTGGGGRGLVGMGPLSLVLGFHTAGGSRLSISSCTSSSSSNNHYSRRNNCISSPASIVSAPARLLAASSSGPCARLPCLPWLQPPSQPPGPFRGCRSKSDSGGCRSSGRCSSPSIRGAGGTDVSAQVLGAVRPLHTTAAATHTIIEASTAGLAGDSVRHVEAVRLPSACGQVAAGPDTAKGRRGQSGGRRETRPGGSVRTHPHTAPHPDVESDSRNGVRAGTSGRWEAGESSGAARAGPGGRVATAAAALTDLRRPATWYPLARSLQRRVVAHLGPTNSGGLGIGGDV